MTDDAWQRTLEIMVIVLGRLLAGHHHCGANEPAGWPGHVHACMQA